VTTWPMAWGPVLQDIENADAINLPPALADALARVKQRASWQTRTNEPTYNTEVGIADNATRIRSFQDTPRGRGEVSAGIWAIYHYPVLLFADYSSAAPRWYAFVMFTVSIVGVSFIATWLRLRSGSVWTGVILHTSHNLFIQGVFDGVTVAGGYTEYFTTEFGAGLAVVYLAGGWWCWRRPPHSSSGA